MLLEFCYCAWDDGHDHDHADDDGWDDHEHFGDYDGHDDVADWNVVNYHCCHFVSTIKCMFDEGHSIFRSNDQV